MAEPKHRSRGKLSAASDISRAFRRFSEKLYGQPGIAPALIRLQDRHGLDVNLLLLCCFAGVRRRGALTKRDLAQANRRIRDWREQVVQPLRAVRRALKRLPLAAGDRPDGALHRRVMQVELASEWQAQVMLTAWLAGRTIIAAANPSADIALSLARYISFATPALDRRGRAALYALAAAALR